MFGELIERKPIPIAFVKEMLEKIKDKNHDQKVAFEYASNFAKLSKEDAEKLMEEIKNAEIPRIREKHIVKLIDIMPKTADEVKAIFAKEELNLSSNDIKRILEILAKYR